MRWRRLAGGRAAPPVFPGARAGFRRTGRLKFHYLNPLHVWKIAVFGFLSAAALHNGLGIAANC